MLDIHTPPTIARDADRADAIAALLDSLELPTARLDAVALETVVLAVAMHPELFADLVADDPVRRWFVPLHLAPNFDVRVLSWGRSRSSDWHDHGGSAGSFAVTAGELHERFRAADGVSVRSRRFVAGTRGSFGATHVHDMVPADGRGAVSVHAYSPPLHALTYYDRARLGFAAREVVPEGPLQLFCPVAD